MYLNLIPGQPKGLLCLIRFQGTTLSFLPLYKMRRMRRAKERLSYEGTQEDGCYIDISSRLFIKAVYSPTRWRSTPADIPFSDSRGRPCCRTSYWKPGPTSSLCLQYKFHWKVTSYYSSLVAREQSTVCSPYPSAILRAYKASKHYNRN